MACFEADSELPHICMVHVPWIQETPLEIRYLESMKSHMGGAT